MPLKRAPGPYTRTPYAVRGGQGNPVGFLLLLAQQVVQMEHRPPVTLGLVAGNVFSLYSALFTSYSFAHKLLPDIGCW